MSAHRTPSRGREFGVLSPAALGEVPTVSADQRFRVGEFPLGFFRVVARYGFTETPGVQAALRTVEI